MEIKTYSRKRKNLSDAMYNNACSIDRLSALPEAILSHIVSFLPTKLSVKTSILSRRWRFVWAGVPNLEFKSDSYTSDISFSDMINRVMLQHNVQSMNSFRLIHRKNCSDYQLETWIFTLAARNIQNLALFLHYQVSLPQCLFTCKSLVELIISRCGFIPKSGAVCLPNLKKLCLSGVRYGATESLSHLLSGCPMLEEFALRFIVAHDLVCRSISSPSIIRLTVDLDFHLLDDEDDEGLYSHDYRLEINIPTLQYLSVYDALTEYLSAGTLPSLVEAELHFENDWVKEDNILYSRSVVEFVNRLRNVECLRLTIGWSEILDSEISTSAMKFPNLTELYVTADWRFISKFLENANNLQHLTIWEADELKCWMEPEKVSECLLSNLTTLKISEFGYSEHEFEMVRYFLKSAKLLERMEIEVEWSHVDFEKQDNAVQRILLFQRRSEECVISFSCNSLTDASSDSDDVS